MVNNRFKKFDIVLTSEEVDKIYEEDNNLLNNQLQFIRQYCDTSGVRLNQKEKDLLFMILENPSRYNGFTSKVYKISGSGRDYRDTYSYTTCYQYRIKIDSRLSILERYKNSSDGKIQDDRWEWYNAGSITDIRSILSILQKIQDEL